MKKIVLILTILMLAGAVLAENVIHSTFYSDGTKKLWPSGGVTMRMYLNGVLIDSDVLDSSSAAGNYRASDSMIICTLQTTSKGKHLIYMSVVDGTDYVDYPDGEYVNQVFDTASIARSVWDNDVVAMLSRYVDSLAIARAVWDNDVIAALLRTVDVASISGDVNVDDNLESMLDSSGGVVGAGHPLTVSQLIITPGTNMRGLTITGNGVADAAYITGGVGGYGLHLRGGSGSGSIAAYLEAQGTSGHGLLSSGSGTGHGGYFYASGTGDGLHTESGTGGKDIYGNIFGSITRADSVGAGGAGVISDSVWQNTRGAFGTYVDGSFGHESFYWDTMGVATVSDADMASLADTILNRDTSDVATAGSIGKLLRDTTAYQGTAAGLDSAGVQGAVIAALNADTTMKFKKINLRQTIIGGENNDSASFLVYNNGTTPAMQIEGDGELGDPALLIHSDSGYGLKMMTDNKSLDGLESSIYSGFYASAAGIKGFGGVFANTNEDSNAAAAGSGLLIKADGWNNGLTITVGEAGDTVGYTGTVPNNKAINVEGPSVFYGRNDFRRMGSASDDAFTVHGKNMGKGFYAYSDSSIGARFSTANGDTSIIIGGEVYFGTGQGIHGNLEGTVDDIDSAITAAVDFSGNGIYDVRVYAIDSSGTDDTIAGVTIEVRNSTNSQKGYVTTGSPGYSFFNLDSGQYTFRARILGGYVWNNAVCTVAAANDTFVLYGYDIAVDTAGQPDKTCQVYCYVAKPDGTPAVNVEVTAALINPAADSAGTAVTTYPYRKLTDSNGRAIFTCYWSSYLVPATKWRFAVPSTNIRKDITVPRQTTYELNF